MDLKEYLQIDAAAAKNFFYQNLRTVIGDDHRIEMDEELYVAGMLADYTQQSGIQTTLPNFTSLAEVKEYLRLLTSRPAEPEPCVAGGEQTLFVNGFLRGHVESLVGVEGTELYDYLGYSFYHAAYKLSRAHEDKELFARMASNFPLWTENCWNLHLYLKDNHYALKSISVH